MGVDGIGSSTVDTGRGCNLQTLLVIAAGMNIAAGKEDKVAEEEEEAGEGYCKGKNICVRQ